MDLFHRAARYVMPYLVIAMTILLVVNIYAVVETKHESEQRDAEITLVTVKNCEAINNISVKLITIFERAKQLSIEHAKNKEELSLALDFYNASIADLQPRKCTEV